jgi:hypothetical protein
MRRHPDPAHPPPSSLLTLVEFFAVRVDGAHFERVLEDESGRHWAGAPVLPPCAPS